MQNTKDIYIITKNIGKLSAAKSAFTNTKINLLQLKEDPFEIQADTSLEIAEFTAKQLAKKHNLNVIREDHSLIINALGGIPGPYTNFIERKIPAELLLNLMKDKDDRTGYFELAATYAEPSGFTKSFVYRINIKISTELKGNKQKGWTQLLILDNETRTFAEYDETERTNVWNKNFIEIVKFIED